MPHLKVVLLEDIENLGHVGQVVNVRGGYGRNYLIPHGKALAATKSNMALMAQRRKVYEAAAAQARGEALAIAERIMAVSVSIARKVGENDQLYGSVTSSDIAEALAKKGVVVDKRRILLPEAVKKLGEFHVPVRIHAEVTADLKVAVVGEE
jgi:large subunit ribosomal protein L9